MAAVATKDTITLRVAPAISPEVREQLALERKRLMADPSANDAPADLSTTARFVFRARPNTHRRIMHTLPMPPDEWKFEKPSAYHYAYRNWVRTVAQPAFPNLTLKDIAAHKFPDLPEDEALAKADMKMASSVAAEKMTEKLNDLRDRLQGSTQVVFNRVARRAECFFPTNDEVVAEYLRGLVKEGKGDFANVYEVSGRRRIVVGDRAFPDTAVGRKLAFAHAAEHGGTMQIVEE